KGFDQPVFQQYSNDPIVLHPGEGIEWTCHYTNNSKTTTYTFGPSAATQEHCILFGQYYPTDTPQEAISCLHDKDAQGNDVPSVHVVHGAAPPHRRRPYRAGAGGGAEAARRSPHGRLDRTRGRVRRDRGSALPPGACPGPLRRGDARGARPPARL